MDINMLTIGFVFNRLDKRGIEQTTVLKNKDYEKVASIIEKHTNLMEESGLGILVKDL
jgi:hypothetical protein